MRRLSLFTGISFDQWRIARRNRSQSNVMAQAPLLSSSRQRSAAVAQAREITLVLTDKLPSDVESWLDVRAPATVQVLCGDFPDASYLLGLLEKGFEVFDAIVPHEALVIFDRRLCYRLSDWSPVPGGFSIACDLLWRRTGHYVCLIGRVGEIASATMFKLMINEAYWTWVVFPDDYCHDQVVAKPGDTVKVLGICSWIGGIGAHLIHGRMLQR